MDPIIKGRQASSLPVLPLLLLPQLHPILQGLNFGQILAAPISSPPPAALFLSVFPDYLLNLVASHHPPPNAVAYVDKHGSFALLVAFWRASSLSSSSLQCGGFGVFTTCKSNNGEHPKAQEAQKEIRSKQ